ncbi:MAG TPA: hypothetical protein PK431_17190 [Chitinophagales bacterium]|nr:hypothetical protein [Chitinophagales bacterium]
MKTLILVLSVLIVIAGFTIAFYAFAAGSVMIVMACVLFLAAVSPEPVLKEGSKFTVLPSNI